MSPLESDHPDIDKLSDFADGKPVGPALAWHARSCPECRDIVETIRMTHLINPENLPPFTEEMAKYWVHRVMAAVEARQATVAAEAARSGRSEEEVYDELFGLPGRTRFDA
jgi:hypothetical protein